MQLILASGSPARLRTLRAAGLRPDVAVSGIDEEAVAADSVTELVAELARRKAQAVADRTVAGQRETLIIGCDSLLELDGQPLGKPDSPAAARSRWHAMRGRTGTLLTGHALILTTRDGTRATSATAATTVHFADLGDAEIDAYVATGEPLEVAGAFTIDGLGGPFVTGIEGDPHNVVGISLPLLRTLMIDLGLDWTSLWAVER
jgi:septum formation protein